MFWLGATVSLCYVPGVTGAYIATQWPVLAVLLTFGLLRSGPFTVWHFVGLLFLCYATVHVFFTPTPQASVFGLWLVWIMGLSMWFGTTMNDVRGLYAGLATGGAASSAVAVLQYSGVEVLPTMSTMPAGLYVNSVQQGVVLSLLVIALFSERMWLWALPLLPGIVLSNSRGAWLALAVGVLACYVRRLWVFGIVGVAAVFYLLMPLAPSDQIRLQIWNAAWHSLTLYGWGPGVFYTILLPRGGALFYPEYAHNDALQLLFEYGIGATLVFAIFLFALLRTQDREWPLVLAFVAAGCYSMPLYMPISAFLALVAVGRVLRSYAVDRGYCDCGGQHVLPWRHADGEAGRPAVPVASHYPAEG
jgi:hypothetical protein